MGHLPNLARILGDIEKASEDEHPDPLTAPYDTLRSLPQGGSGDPYIPTDSSSDVASTGSSCCSPTDDQEAIPSALPPARKPSPSGPHTVNGNVKVIQQQLLSNQNQKSVSLPTSSSTSPMPGQTSKNSSHSSKNSSHSSNKDVVRSYKKSHKASLPSNSIGEKLDDNHSFSHVYGEEHPSNLDDAIANV